MGCFPRFELDLDFLVCKYVPLQIRISWIPTLFAAPGRAFLGDVPTADSQPRWKVRFAAIVVSLSQNFIGISGQSLLSSCFFGHVLRRL